MNQFEEIDAFAPSTPIPREVTFNGKTTTFFFIQHGYDAFMVNMANPHVEEGHRRELVILQNTLRIGADGSEVPTYDQLARLNRDLLTELFHVAHHVNNVDTRKKDDEPAGDTAKN
jgi:hypothetical protein